MPGHEHPIPWVPAQKNLLPVGIEPGTSRTEVRLTNHLASRTGHICMYVCMYTTKEKGKFGSCNSEFHALGDLQTMIDKLNYYGFIP